MSDPLLRNQRFLRNIYAHGPFEGHAFVCTPPLLGICDHPDYDYTISDQPVQNWVGWVVENYTRQVRHQEALGDDHVPCARLTTGTHLFAAAFGCEVHRFTDSNPAALPRVFTAAEADAVEEPDLWKSPTLYRTFELAHAVQAELGKEVFLGPPDMQSGFDTAALVWDKGDFLRAMADPEQAPAVHRLADTCARLYKRFLIEFRREFPQCVSCHCPNTWSPPEMGPWLSNDECGAFSRRMFQEFCLPELIDLAETFGGLGMHCCAAAEHQFTAFRAIPNFYAFNRVKAQQGYDTILEPLGGPDGPVFVLAWLEAEDIERLLRTAPPGSRFIFELNGAELPDAQVWLERMRRSPWARTPC